ncbi:hypothetical protein E4U43_005034 [Claviceps pusilla]|uniref:FAD-binding FR-type domain-containing protein n=1 Tax=Claviceps pusilla TaxID=123648 RepID=A0A9P7N3F2_9HYPO|nr:hypothetical protein E4U43_005034 [Claviceps pusilla]
MAAPPLLRTFAMRARHISQTCQPRGPRPFNYTNDATHCNRRSSKNSHFHHKQARVLPPAAIALVILGTATYLLTSSSRTSTILNETTFVPYTITARDAISPSSVLFTISPHQRHEPPPPPYLLPQSTRWRYPLWSVEFKQPEVQIARHYTPLPPQQDEDRRDGKLRFYVRAVGGGEMSNYLLRLRVGNEVYLRGPHPGFDILGRLGACKNVVFLAGGTGVVPGMQVAVAVLEGDESSQVKLLWAVRKREEIQSVAFLTQQQQQQQKPAWWKVWTATTRPAPMEITTDLENPSAMARELMRLKARFGQRLHIRLAVDEERTRFTAQDVQSALRSCEENGPSHSHAVVVDNGCPLHDQLLHTQISEFEDPRAACQCRDVGSDSRLSGKNLFMVSGPDGFIAHYAGEKMWLNGARAQGPVEGVAGQLQRRDPSLSRNWLVLKL